MPALEGSRTREGITQPDSQAPIQLFVVCSKSEWGPGNEAQYVYSKGKAVKLVLPFSL